MNEKLNREPVVINPNLVVGDLEFTTPLDRCRYLGTSTWDRLHWLKANPGSWRRIEGVQREAPSPAPPVESEIKVGAAPAGPNSQTSSSDVRNDGDDEDSVALVDTLVGDCLLPQVPSSPPTPATKPVANETPDAELPNLPKLGMSEVTEPKTETTLVGAMRRKPDRSGGRKVRKQKLPAEISELGRKCSPARQRITLDSLAEYPVKILAANKAGIHRNTFDYWLRRSAAGDDGYDIEWRGHTAKFHEHYKSAMKEGTDKLEKIAYEIALGYDEIQTYHGHVVYKIDEILWSHGYRGPDAYLRDEKGSPIPETVLKKDSEMIRWVLERRRPDKWGKHRNIDVTHKGGVLVVVEKLNTENLDKESGVEQQIQDVESVVEDDSEGKK
jgi:hypothetical protein